MLCRFNGNGLYRSVEDKVEFCENNSFSYVKDYGAVSCLTKAYCILSRSAVCSWSSTLSSSLPSDLDGDKDADVSSLLKIYAANPSIVG